MNTSSLAEESGIVPTMIRAAALAKIEVHPLRRNISVLEGSGGNIVVLSGKDRKLHIDAGFTVSKPRVAPALDSLSTDPITRLINTHWHVDHTDGNAWLHAAGAAITTHGNTKKHLATSTRIEGWSYTFTPAPAEALPMTTFRDAHRLRHNDTSLTLKYYGPAHTDGDISVVFEEADVIQVGDTCRKGFYPFIDYSTGGSIDGMINATKWNLSVVTEKTIIIPGHSPVADKARLTEYYNMLAAIRENVAKLKKQGRSQSETIAAKPTAWYDAKWGQFLMTPAIFTGACLLASLVRHCGETRMSASEKPLHIDIPVTLPVTDSHRLTAQEPIRTKSGAVRIVDSSNFPAAKMIAGGLVEIEPDGMREIHWHSDSVELQYYIERKARMTVYASGNDEQTFHYQGGDVGYVSKGMPHYIENTGLTRLRYLELWPSDRFADVSLAQWLAFTPYTTRWITT